MTAGFGNSNRKYVYVTINAKSNAETATAKGWIASAASAGFTDIIFGSSSTLTSTRLQAAWITNYKDILQTCKDNGLRVTLLVPEEASGETMYVDMDLSAAYPTWGYFQVTDGVANLIPDPSEPATIYNGNFESDVLGAGDYIIPGCRSIDADCVSIDATVQRRGSKSVRFDLASSDGQARIRLRAINVVPWRHYRITGWVRTVGVSNPEVFGIYPSQEGGTRTLNYLSTSVFNVPSDTDSDPNSVDGWYRVDHVFNTMECTVLNVWVGCWGSSSGQLWLDDLEIAQVGLLNVIRRDDFAEDSAPLVVQSQNGLTTYVEGTHYNRVTDPLADWHSGEVRPNKQYWRFHADPGITIKNGSIANGTILKVSWYHPVWQKSGIVQTELCLPEATAVINSAIDYIDDLYNEIYGESCPHWMSGLDELRMGGASKWYDDTGTTPAQAIADTLKSFYEKITSIRADADLLVWSDMLDPDMNAVSNYYLWKGELSDSADRMTIPYSVYNWSVAKKVNGEWVITVASSAEYFDTRGVASIISVNIGGTDVPGFTSYYESMDGIYAQLAGGVPLAGMGYTTWTRNYSYLKDFSERTTYWYAIENLGPSNAIYASKRFDDAYSLFAAANCRYMGTLPRLFAWAIGDRTSELTANEHKTLFDTSFYGFFFGGGYVADDPPMIGSQNVLQYFAEHPELPVMVQDSRNYAACRTTNFYYTTDNYSTTGSHFEAPSSGEHHSPNLTYQSDQGDRYVFLDSGGNPKPVQLSAYDSYHIIVPILPETIQFWEDMERLLWNHWKTWRGDLSPPRYVDDIYGQHLVDQLATYGITPVGVMMDWEDYWSTYSQEAVALYDADPRFNENDMHFDQNQLVAKNVAMMMDARVRVVTQNAPWLQPENSRLYDTCDTNWSRYYSYATKVDQVYGRKKGCLSIYPYYQTTYTRRDVFYLIGETVAIFASAGVHFFEGWHGPNVNGVSPVRNPDEGAACTSIADTIAICKTMMALGSGMMTYYNSSGCALHALYSMLIAYNELQYYADVVKYGENYVPPLCVYRPNKARPSAANDADPETPTVFYGFDYNGSEIDEDVWIACRVYKNQMLFVASTTDYKTKTVTIRMPTGDPLSIEARPWGNIVLV